MWFWLCWSKSTLVCHTSLDFCWYWYYYPLIGSTSTSQCDPLFLVTFDPYMVPVPARWGPHGYGAGLQGRSCAGSIRDGTCSQCRAHNRNNFYYAPPLFQNSWSSSFVLCQTSLSLTMFIEKYANINVKSIWYGNVLYDESSEMKLVFLWTWSNLEMFDFGQN